MTTSTSQKPTVVLVPGSFSPSSMYSALASQLTHHGYPTTLIDLPSVHSVSSSSTFSTPATMAIDASHIRSITSALADEGKDIILAMHSYGGIPGTESAQGVGKEERKKQGKKGGVVRLVYYTSFMVAVGKGLRDMTGAKEGDMPTVVSNLNFCDSLVAVGDP
jgi:hypothetical protein